MIRFQLGEGVPRDILPPHMLTDTDVSAAEMETIARALRDMESDNPEHRAGAVMLLGKYEREEARQAVIKGLEDPSTRVRRAALVSVTEWNHQAPPEAVDPVLRRVADDDVEIRRTASSMLSSMIMIRRFARMLQARHETAPPEMIPADIQEGLRRAFQDEDALVRRNMITQFHAAGVEVPPSTLLQLMLDPDRHVRIEAIALAAALAPPDAFVEQARLLVDDADRGVRLRLVRQLSAVGGRADDVLAEMALDEDAEVTADALLGRLNWRPRADIFAQLLERLYAGNLRREQGQRFLQWMRRSRELAQPHVVDLLGLEDAVLRREAARLFFDLRLAESHPEIVRALLADPSPEVRQLATGYLHTEPEMADQVLVADMLVNPHEDVRHGLVTLCAHLPPARADILLQDLMLDESMKVRVSALQRIVERRSDGWRDYLRNSLRDPHIEMQRNALDLVVRLPEDEARAVLEHFLETHPDSPLSPLIRRYLINHKPGASNL